MTKPFKRVPAEVPVSALTPLNVTCGSTKCDDGLHCFKSSERSIKKYGEAGVCKECGVELIDWARVHKNNIDDAKFIFDSLKNELIRHVFWHTHIQEDAIRNARQLGAEKLRIHARKLIEVRIGGERNFREGYQTPKTGKEIVHYAQHATATCCRKCLEYWHNIEMGKDLTELQLNFCTDLVMLYISERVPDLFEHRAN